MKVLPSDDDACDTIHMHNKSENQHLYSQALESEKDDRLLEAARILQNLKLEDGCESQYFTKEHEEILKRANRCENILKELRSKPNPSWNKIKDSYNHQDLTVHFKVVKKTNVCCRIESVIDKSLLCPLLSVLNETELYNTWLPSWDIPKFKIRRSTKLHQRGRVSQILLLSVDLPWPVKPREVIIDAVAFDDIDANGEICIMLEGINDALNEYIPAMPEHNHIRIVFKGGFLFRKYSSSRNQNGSLSSESDVDNDNDNLIQVSFFITYDTIYFQIPEALLNFLLRVAAAKMWKKFLRVAEDIRDGKRPQHMDIIESKRSTLYDWVDQRVEMLLL